MKKTIITAAYLAAACLIAKANDITPDSTLLLHKDKVTRIAPLRSPSRADNTVDAWYLAPLSRQFHGIDRISDSYPENIEVYPADETLIWENLSDNQAPTAYTWVYTDPADLEPTGDDATDLQALYPMASLPATSTLDGLSVPGFLTTAPELTAYSGGQRAEYSSSRLMQIGGAPIVTSTRGRNNRGLLPFGAATDSVGIYVQDGDIPVFGYSPNTTEWMTRLALNGREPVDESVAVNAVFNTLIATEQPLTVRGARFFAKGKLHDSAVLTFLIYPTTEDGDFITTPMAMAKCPVADMTVIPDGDMNIYEIPFTLGKAVELSAEQAPYFLVGVTGFYESADWFAPYQSIRPNEYGLTLGYYRCTVKYKAEYDDWYMWQVANFENEYGEMYSTFAISLDAAYPWRDDPWSDGIGSIITDSAERPAGTYDTLGRKVAPETPGLVITDGTLRLNR